MAKISFFPSHKQNHPLRVTYTMNYLIIGGNTGINLEVVNKLIKEGHSVYVASRENSNLPSGVVHQKWDASAPTPLTGLPETIDGLVYGPGTINLKPFHRLVKQDFLEELQINFLSAVEIIQQILPALKKSENPAIMMFSTVAVQTGMSFHAGIASAKGAVEGLVRTLAAELAPKIRVNAIAPSLTESPLAGKLLSTPEKKEASGQRHPLKRVGTTEDLSNAVLFLLTDKSAWITGQVLGVDGGMGSVRMI